MSPEEFQAWQKRMNFSRREAGIALGASYNFLVSMEKKGAPRYIALACAALAFGLPPWGFPEKVIHSSDDSLSDS